MKFVIGIISLLVLASCGTINAWRTGGDVHTGLCQDARLAVTLSTSELAKAAVGSDLHKYWELYRLGAEQALAAYCGGGK